MMERRGVRIFGKVCALIALVGGFIGFVTALLTVDFLGLVTSLVVLFCGQCLCVYEFQYEIATDAVAGTHVHRIIDALALDVPWRRGGASFAAAIALAMNESGSVLVAVAVLALIGNAIYLLLRSAEGASSDRPSSADYSKVAQAHERDSDLFAGTPEEKADAEAGGTFTL